MIPIFKKLSLSSKNNEIQEIERHINALQKELRECMAKLSSDNVEELSLDYTKLSSGNGSYLFGDMIMLRGKGEECYTAGYSRKDGSFSFSLKDKDGNVVFSYIDGKLTVTGG